MHEITRYVVLRIAALRIAMLKAEPIFASLHSDFVALRLMESRKTNRSDIYNVDAAVAI